VPFEYEFSFFIGFKTGLRSSIGPMPDIAYQFDHATAEVKDCEYVSNPFRSNAGGDEDDFDEDSDEDEDSNGNDKS